MQRAMQRERHALPLRRRVPIGHHVLGIDSGLPRREVHARARVRRGRKLEPRRRGTALPDCIRRSRLRHPLERLPALARPQHHRPGPGARLSTRDQRHACAPGVDPVHVPGLGALRLSVRRRRRPADGAEQLHPCMQCCRLEFRRRLRRRR